MYGIQKSATFLPGPAGPLGIQAPLAQLVTVARGCDRKAKKTPFLVFFLGGKEVASKYRFLNF